MLAVHLSHMVEKGKADLCPGVRATVQAPTGQCWLASAFSPYSYLCLHGSLCMPTNIR